MDVERDIRELRYREKHRKTMTRIEGAGHRIRVIQWNSAPPLRQETLIGKAISFGEEPLLRKIGLECVKCGSRAKKGFFGHTGQLMKVRCVEA